jgi:hypothetical protein
MHGRCSDKLPTPLTGKYKIPQYFKNVKRLPTKFEANTNSWVNNKIFEDYIIQLDIKLSAKNCKILLFIDQCAAYLKNTKFLNNNKVVSFAAN